MNSFRDVFNPSPEYRHAQNERYKNIVRQSYDEKWCCTCKNFIPIDDSLPGFITAFPRCKVGGLAVETCELYESDRKSNNPKGKMEES